ncbi:serine protease [Candidatus Magnetomoraceae bacterium gMMP-1]
MKHFKIIFSIIMIMAIGANVFGQDERFVNGELILTFKENLSFIERDNILNKHNLEIIRAYTILPDTYYVRKTDLTVSIEASAEQQPVMKSLVSLLNTEAEIKDVFLNYMVSAIKAPNDPGIDCVWAMNNTGQTGGSLGADIDAYEAWDTQTGSSSVIVGIIDSGIDYDHPDLAANMWKNPNEIPNNGVDDDNNGYVDDVYGWDWFNNDNDPSDDYGHGTHCAGIVGAVGNNGKGVAGVCWNVKLMALKFLNEEGDGSVAAAIFVIEYAALMGATLTSNSWGWSGESFELLKSAISCSNMLFIVAAGNESSDNDFLSNYPSGFALDNIISVAAVTHNDQLAHFSNYGAVSVDLAAPGVNIVSTRPNNSTGLDDDFKAPGCGLSSDYYGIISGTSMAAPYVSGAAALVYSKNPSMTWQEIKAALLDNVDRISSLNDKTLTGGRLNVSKALGESESSEITVDPQSLAFTLTKGSSATDILIIENTGKADLEWKLLESSANSQSEIIDQNSGYPETYYAQLAKGAVDTRVGNSVQTHRGGPDNFGYIWTDSDEEGGPVFDWIDISDSGALATGSKDDNYVGPFSIGFPFCYYGNEYTEFYIASNGYIGFGSTEGLYEYTNRPIPADGKPDNILAWCWCDLRPEENSVYYKTVDNKLIIQFVNYAEYSSNQGSVNAQVIIESNGTIIYQYKNFINNFETDKCTIGIENADGTDGLEVAFNTDYLHKSLAIRFSVEIQWIFATPESGTVLPDALETVTLKVDAENITPGDYSKLFLITSNDPFNPKVEFPVSVRVIPDSNSIISFEFDLKKGWNLISMPLIPNDCSLSSIFPDAEVAYEFKDGGYASVNSLEPGKGYWLKIPDDKKYNITGQEFIKYQVDIMNSGWQLMGAVNGITTPEVQAGSDIEVMYAYSDGSYNQITEFQPGRGYWVKISQPSVFTVDGI